MVTSTQKDGPLSTDEAGRVPVGESSSTKILLMLATGALLAAPVYIFAHSVLLSAMILVATCVCVAFYVGIKAFTGVFLLLMSVQFLAIGLLGIFGVSQYKEISGIKEIVLSITPLWFFFYTSRYKILLPDILLLASLFVVIFGQIFSPDIGAVRLDWEWVLPYALGRVVMLSPEAQELWAKCAVWMCAFLAVLGAWEVFFLDDKARRLLLSVMTGETRLPTAFRATGYNNLRAASSTNSPLTFAAFCMVALVLWWAYMKNPLPGLLIGFGLVLTVTRSAVLGTVLGVLVISLRRRERVRILAFVMVAIIGIAIAIPTLDLKKFVDASFSSGGDVSLQGHVTSVSDGFEMALQHPLGTGAGTVGPRTAVDIENSYLTLAVEYGLLGGLLFTGFIIACLWTTFTVRKPIGYAAFSALSGFSILLAVGPANEDLAIGCWIWFLVGQAVSLRAEAPKLLL